MLELTAHLGRLAVDALLVPVAVWTAVALAAEAALRVGRAGAALALPVRGAVLAALPVGVAVPALLAWFAPEAAVAVAAAAPTVAWLPGVTVGAPLPEVVASGPDPAAVAAGLAVAVAVGLAAVRLGQFAVALVRASQTRRALPDADAEVRAAVADARERLGVARPVAPASAPRGAAPFTLGWRRPLVALPPGLDAEAREVAAVHEVAHVRRGDYAWHAAQRAVAAAFAAHPLVGVLARGLDLDRERAADAAVLAACPGRRRAYADLLFSYASLPAPPLALGAVGGSSALKTRIDTMTRPTAPTTARRLGWAGRLAGLALAAVVALGAVAGAPSPAVASAPADLRVESLRLATTDAGEPVALDLYLAADATEADARAALDHADSDEPDAVVLTGRAHVGDRVVQREIRLSRGTTSFGGVSVGLDGAPRRAGLVDRFRALADTTEIFEVVDEQPELIGGLAGVQERLVYPELAKRAGIEGQVVVQFVVTSGGGVTDARVVRSPDDMLSDAALAAVRELRFVPGRQNGEPVAVRFALPITFALREGEGAAPVETGQTETGRSEVFMVVEEMPQIVGGLAALQERVVYPPIARDAGVEGTVVVQFLVNETGGVDEAQVMRSPSEALSAAALEAVRGLTFTPGRQRGQAVKVRFAVPVTFRLPDGDGEDRGEYRLDGSRRDGPASDRAARSRDGFRLDGSRIGATPVSFSGVDVERLTPGSRTAFENTLRGMPELFERWDTEPGTVVVEFLTDDHGRVIASETTRGSGAIAQAAAFLLGTLELAEDARPGPGGTWAGTFRLVYTGQG